jgi:hypothetical protein
MAKSGIPLSEWSGSGATKHLEETVTALNERTEAQTAEMIRLARTLTRMTAVMAVAVVVQIAVGIVAVVIAAS